MTNSLKFSPDFWNWVKINADKNPAKLLLSSQEVEGDDLKARVLQVECRQRFGKKLEKTLSLFPDFFFPSTLAGEQSTSDMLAQYHEKFISNGDSVVDLTAGLGIDALHLARKAEKVTAIEKNGLLVSALRYNACGLNIDNIQVIEGDCRQLIGELQGDVVFVDPARRAADGSRVFGLEQCEPDILKMMPEIKANFKRIIIKASPMLDITKSIEEVENVSDIYLLGTSTECKELIIIAESNKTQIEPIIHAVTLMKDSGPVEFTFTMSQERDASVELGRPDIKIGDLLYLPYPATIKALPIKLLAERYGLKKFHQNTHIYYGTAIKKAGDFPGEIFEIADIIPWQSKNLKRFKSKYPNVMVSVRNFGMTADALRTKLGVKEGGNSRLRLFGIGLGKDHTDRILVVCRELT